MKKVFIALLLFIFQLPTGLAVDWSELIDAQKDSIVGTVSLKGSKVSDNVLKIDVVMSDFSKPVLGVSFDLYYSENLKFLRYEPGNYLEQGGDPVYLVSEGQNKNNSVKTTTKVNSGDRVKLNEKKIIYGVTLMREDSFPLGSGVLSSLYFEMSGNDLSHLDFQRGVISTIDTVRQDLDNVGWQDAIVDKDGNVISQNSDGENSLIVNKRNIFSFNVGNFLMGSLFMILLVVAYKLVRKRDLD